jgi:hypothetical protein
MDNLGTPDHSRSHCQALFLLEILAGPEADSRGVFAKFKHLLRKAAASKPSARQSARSSDHLPDEWANSFQNSGYAQT